jgi:hypothetical protein
MEQTQIREDVGVREPRGLALRGKVLVVVSAVLAFLGLGPAAASFATTSDPTGGVFTTAQSDLSSLIIPAAAGLVIIGIVFAVAVKWMGKGMKKS